MGFKIEMSGKRVAVHFRLSSWEDAARDIVNWRQAPPDGYRLIDAHVKPRTGEGGKPKSGRRCNLSLIFELCLRDSEPFTEEEAYAFFRRQASPPPEPASVSG